MGAGHMLSAVVVNYNAGEAITRCLASLQMSGISDLVVVDNDSTDGSAELARGLDPPVELIRPGRNLGYGAAANLGVAGTPAALRVRWLGVPIGPLVPKPWRLSRARFRGSVLA